MNEGKLIELRLILRELRTQLLGTSFIGLDFSFPVMYEYTDRNTGEKMESYFSEYPRYKGMTLLHLTTYELFKFCKRENIHKSPEIDNVINALKKEGFRVDVYMNSKLGTSVTLYL